MPFLAIIAGIVVLLAALAALAPATLLDARLEGATQGQLRLADAEGTVWNGRGVVTGGARTWSLPLRWHVEPWPLLRGELVLSLHSTGRDDLPRGTISWRNGAVTLDGVVLAVPATALQGFVRGDALTLGGYVALDAPHFRWDGRGGDGAASASWNGARAAGDAGNIALGMVNANFAPRDGRIRGHVDNRGGDVRIDGEFAWGDAGASVNATVSPLPTTPPAMQRALGALGTPDATGAVRVQWRSGSP